MLHYLPASIFYHTFILYIFAARHAFHFDAAGMARFKMIRLAYTTMINIDDSRGHYILPLAF